MINYILVDDDESFLHYVKSKIDAISEDYGFKHLASFNSSKKANDEASSFDFDLLIVDYEMPVFNGVELAKRIAKSKKVIFLTSTKDNEQKIINSVDIVGFLSKPFEIEAFLNIIKNKMLDVPKSKEKNSSDSCFLPIGTGGGVHLKLNDTYFISTMRTNDGHQPKPNHVNIYGKNQELLFKNVRGTITQLAEILILKNFEKINQSTLINKIHIKQVDDVHMKLYNTKESFKISKKEKHSFLQRLKDAFS